MESSSINTSYTFRGFKVDRISLEMPPNMETLELGNYTNYDWEMNVSVRHLSFFVKHKVYVAGVDCNLNLYPKNGEKKAENALLKLSIGCAGSFGVTQNRFDPRVEERIVKLQFTALLFTQLRAAIGSLLAGAGYGSVLLPLINIQAMFENKLEQITISNIEN